MNLNKAHLIGRVTRDPELRTLPSGSGVVKFGLATNHSYKKQSGEKVETTQFHNCVAFGPLAEKVIAPYCKKGQEVYVSGRIEYREWEAKDGTKRTSTEIMVEDFQLGQKPQGQRSEPRAQSPADVVEQAFGGKQDDSFDGGDINVEDISF